MFWKTIDRGGKEHHTNTKLTCIQLNMGFLCGSAGKESACNVGDLDSIPGLGRSPGGGKCHPLQYSGLENSMDCIVSTHYTFYSFYTLNMLGRKEDRKRERSKSKRGWRKKIQEK